MPDLKALPLSLTLADARKKKIPVHEGGRKIYVLCEELVGGNIAESRHRKAFELLSAWFRCRLQAKKPISGNMRFLRFERGYRFPSPMGYWALKLVEALGVRDEPWKLQEFPLQSLVELGRDFTFSQINAALLELEGLSEQAESSGSPVQAIPGAQELKRFRRLWSFDDSIEAIRDTDLRYGSMMVAARAARDNMDPNGILAGASLYQVLILDERNNLLEEIGAISESLARAVYGLTGNDSLLDNLPASRLYDMLCCRYGVKTDGKPMTLEQIGNRHGLSKERVRQILGEAAKLARDRGVFSLPFRRLEMEVRKTRLPVLENDIIQRQTKLIGASSLAGAASFYREIVGGCLYDRREEIYGVAVLSDTDMEWFRSMVDAAHKMTWTAGAACLSVLHSNAVNGLEYPVDSKRVAALLECVEGFEWLDEGEWFWFGPPEGHGKNQVVNAAMKMLSVAQQPLTADELMVGIARKLYSKGAAGSPLHPLPLHVLKKLLCRLKGVQCKHYKNYLLEPSMAPDRTEWLCESEQMLVDFLLSKGGIASRTEIQAWAKGRFTDALTLFMLSWSPILHPVTKGIYSIVGHPLDAGRLSDLLEERQEKCAA